ncbi:Indole-3-glycerol phosphate synthase [Planctomycetes bacterium CA13]|uniref:Indole-3-glycerol phosphate synthase n=1 Tax=Novipirellula herctigrandis TaxID=2527986 RepID=A0A5C5Z0W5_9BACT|nr:Indole-3-glycerol phosphate synthase [Planctomycetes bacterium CA13]
MTILDKIIVETRKTIAHDKANRPESDLESAIAGLPPCRDFHAALACGGLVQLIAEVKRASPSAGLIRDDFNPVQIAEQYVTAGAACISVLTDEPFFKGSLDYLRDVRRAVDVPLLRKDFIVDRYQLLQAREAGADCALLIAECLSADELVKLHDEAVAMGLQTLIELFEPSNLDAVLATGTPLVGINNRDLKTFHTDIEHTIRMRELIPGDRLVVGESGIRTHDDLIRLGKAGVKAVLVGESLMRKPDIEQATRELLGDNR